MADKDRNRQDAYRQQDGWNDNNGSQQSNNGEEPNYTNSENRGHRRSGRHSEMNSGDGGSQSRYERQMHSGREGDFDGGNYQRQSGRGNDPKGNRNLYDRGDQGMGRRDFENSENRIGGGNYDRYGDRGRYGDRNSGGKSDYGRSGRSDYERGGHDHGYGSGDSDERSWWNRTTDEVSSWFGNGQAERRKERDHSMKGEHRGKGPRNYSRSDERIKEDINDRLSDDPFVDASEVEVAVTNGEVTLVGTVDHRSTKRHAEDLAEAVSGVKNVENRLRVSQVPGVKPPVFPV